MEFEKELVGILDTYTDYTWQNEPLDSDETSKLAEHLKNQLDLINGNITREEYFQLETTHKSILDDYRVVEIRDLETAELISAVLLNNKHSVEELQEEFNNTREKYRKQIEEFGNDIETILGNMSNEIDWLDISCQTSDYVYL